MGSSVDYRALVSLYGAEEAAEIQREFERLIPLMDDSDTSLGELTDASLYDKRRPMRQRVEARMKAVNVAEFLRQYGRGTRIKRGDIESLMRRKLKNTVSHAPYPYRSGRRAYVDSGSQVGRESGM